MPVDLEQGLDTHAEVAGRLEGIDPPLHEPGRRSVAHDMWAILATTYRRPGPPQLADGLPAVVDDMRDPVRAIKSVPAPQMR